MPLVRRMPANRRLELAIQMSKSLLEVVTAGVRRRHPDFLEGQVRLAVLRLVLGEELFGRVYPGARTAP